MGQRQGQLDEATEHWQTPANPTFTTRKQVGATVREALLPSQAESTTSPCSRPDPAPAPNGDESSPSAPTSRPRLNPAFVEWLMNLPEGWTDFAPLETASSRWKQRTHLELSGLVCRSATK